jgi:hypothetical protein
MTDAPESAPDWRRVIALLANDRTREVFAHIVVAGGHPSAHLRDLPQFERSLEALVEAQVVQKRDGEHLVNGKVFRSVLKQAAMAEPKVEGVHRFVKHGRIHSYPSGEDDRRKLLSWVVTGVLQDGEELTETEINERLALYGDDYVKLRRYLVDFGLVQRTNTGSRYFLPTLAVATPPSKSE